MNIRVEELYESWQRKIEEIPDYSTLTEPEARVWRFITKFPNGIASVLELNKKYPHKLRPNKDIVWIASRRYWKNGIGYVWAGIAFDAAAKIWPMLIPYAGNIKVDNLAEAADIANQVAAPFEARNSTNSQGAAMHAAVYAAHIVERSLRDAEGIAQDAASASEYAVKAIALADAEAADIKAKALIRERERTVEWQKRRLAASAAASTIRNAAYDKSQKAFEETYERMREIALQWLKAGGNPNQLEGKHFASTCT